MITGARKLTTHHITLRVPWHDDGWRGTVCKDPRANTTCLIGMPRIAQNKDDTAEHAVRGRGLNVIEEKQHPACAGERGTFLAPFEISATKEHPYTKWSTLHRDFRPTTLLQPAFSAWAVPFRWMLRKQIEDTKEGKGIANRLRIGWDPEREPELTDKEGKVVPTAWAQQRDNQLVLLDTFFSAVEAKASLCFFYAKRTPLSEEPRRVIIGVGRVHRVGDAVEYKYSSGPGKSPTRSVLWERSIEHSIRSPEFEDGFVMPYAELLGAADADPAIRLDECVAFAPDEFFEQFSYGSELLAHDGAIASLLSCAQALRNAARHVDGPWERCLRWIDREINRLWELRGPFPGLGSALTAFGLEHGTLVAHAIAELQGDKKWRDDPWAVVDAVFAKRSLLPNGLGDLIGKNFSEKWNKLKKTRRGLLQLLSRCALREDQTRRFYQETERDDAGITVTDDALLKNPYLLYELDRGSFDPVDVGTVDRGVYPETIIRDKFPLVEPSAMEDAIDKRRVRALIIDTLEQAARQGDTLLPSKWVISRIRERGLSPLCPLDEDTLSMHEAFVGEHVTSTRLDDDAPALQLDRYVNTRDLIRAAIRKRITGKRHSAKHEFTKLIDNGLGVLPTEPKERNVELRARQEKAAALAELFSSRFSVLIGPAGTGKTTLLRMLCNLPDVERGGILLLAPTGKARVRLEQQTGRQGDGQTLAQFLRKWERYEVDTGAYIMRGADTERCGEYETVVIDECSMLTEDQLAATIDALDGVDRLVLVGDPQQLPPIGAGRPFVDIVKDLAPSNIDGQFPRVAGGYAELTVMRRQEGVSRDDLLLAQHFSGRALDPGADEVWERIESGAARNVRMVRWDTSAELESKLIEAFVAELKLTGPDDERGFELSIGGSDYNGTVFFWSGRNGQPGAAEKADAWQIISPVRPQLHGVDSLNRIVQGRFRKRALEMATVEPFWKRKIPRPLGPQGILWGDKVMNTRNRSDLWTIPKNAEGYVANGDIGIAVGDYKTQHSKGIPEHLHVEMSSQWGLRFIYPSWEFGGDEPNPSVDLAYALTVHKTQGSEFGITFVVLPKPCRLLSRELLYTALTRHRERIIILHQGPARELLSFASAKWSALAGRMTNLFKDPKPVPVTVAGEHRFLEDRLVHRTENNELVLSKSEVVIANALRARKIRYAYERTRTLNGKDRYPDFTIEDAERGITFYWEHLGMLGDPSYDERWSRKLAAYRAEGILPLDEGGGLNGTLIVTRDENGSIDSKAIGELIDRVLV